ncbi:hydroxymethylglutaryl-CoA lyase [Pseudochelatococcus sp. B33]
MSDLPKKSIIREEGPREGFQIEEQIISTEDKLRFIDSLAQAGVPEIQCVSFVNPKLVPNMADAEEVAKGIKRVPGVRYTGIWLNLKGFLRALEAPLDRHGTLQMSASETFSIRNTNRDTAATVEEQRKILDAYLENKVPVDRAYVMTAFGCNFEGSIAPETVRDRVATILDIAAERDVKLNTMMLADTVGWANPEAVSRVVGLIRERWPDLQLGLHLHDTRGLAMANALRGLELGVQVFDAACAGLGGCPFAGHKGAAGNICTEDLVFLCQELGIETGIDLDALIESAQLAESILGRPLAGKIMHSGSLNRYRQAA